MQNLSAEILGLITPHLSNDDLFNTQLVSKQLREGTQGNLYKKVFEEKFGSLAPSEMDESGISLIKRNLHHIEFKKIDLPEGHFLSFDQEGLPIFKEIPKASGLLQKYQIFKQGMTSELVNDLNRIREKLKEILDENLQLIQEVNALEIDESYPFQSLRNRELRVEDLHDYSYHLINLFEGSIESCQEAFKAQNRSTATLLKIVFYMAFLFDFSPSYQIPARFSLSFKKSEIADASTIRNQYHFKEASVGDRCKAYIRRGSNRTREGEFYFRLGGSELKIQRKWHRKGDVLTCHECYDIKKEDPPFNYCELNISYLEILDKKTTLPLIYQLAAELLERESINAIEVSLGHLSKNPMKGFESREYFNLAICDDPEKCKKLGTKFITFDSRLSKRGKWRAAKVRFSEDDEYVTWEKMLEEKGRILNGSVPVLPRFYRNNFWKYLDSV